MRIGIARRSVALAPFSGASFRATPGPAITAVKMGLLVGTNCMEVATVWLVLVVVALLGLCVLLRAKAGRKVKYHHYLATVRLLCNRRVKFPRLDVLLSFAKMVLVRGVLVVVLKDCIVMPLLRIAWWIAVAWM